MEQASATRGAAVWEAPPLPLHFKETSAMEAGVLRVWDARGYGFVRPASGGDIFVHGAELRRSGIATPLVAGTVLWFERVIDGEKRRATRISVLDVPAVPATATSKL
jgi:cold shock CspA family protein